MHTQAWHKFTHMLPSHQMWVHGLEYAMYITPIGSGKKMPHCHNSYQRVCTSAWKLWLRLWPHFSARQVEKRTHNKCPCILHYMYIIIYNCILTCFVITVITYTRRKLPVMKENYPYLRKLLVRGKLSLPGQILILVMKLAYKILQHLFTLVNDLFQQRITIDLIGVLGIKLCCTKSVSHINVPSM